MAIYGGVLGWIVGVVVRAGPMHVPDGECPMPWPGWLRGHSAWVSSSRERASRGRGPAGPGWRSSGPGRRSFLATVGAIALRGGAFRGAPGALPMAARGGPETWLFRMAMLAAGVAAAGSIGAAALAWTGVP